MSLPNYLAKIKSSGVYRYVFDLSEIPAEERSTLRLVVGYSERGVFNTPVYIEEPEEFITTFGNISRRMERKGIFFHRLALQALEKGPILALNIKPFNEGLIPERAKMMSFNASDLVLSGDDTQKQEIVIDLQNANVASAGNMRKKVNSIYDTNRFWKVTENIMTIDAAEETTKSDYLRIVQTGSKEDSVTLFIRPYIPTGYDIKIADWYANETQEDMPSYMEPIQDHYLSEFFAEVYVFKGKLNDPNLFTSEGTLGNWIPNQYDEDGNPVQKWQPFCVFEGDQIMTNPDYVNSFGEKDDALEAMTNVTTSNFINSYSGILFPNFRSGTGSTISLDSVFNRDYTAHNCLMAMDESLLDDAYEADMNLDGEYGDGEDNPGDTNTVSGLVHKLCSAVHFGDSVDASTYELRDVLANASINGYYLEGYTYNSIARNEKGKSMQDKIFKVLGYKGMFEALTNNVDSDYKYWVDTFQAYPGPSMRADVASILKKKFNCLGILNFPTIYDCALSVGYPGVKGGFDMKEVVDPFNGISLPNDSQGGSWCAFYTQLQFSDGSNKFYVPSAGLVSNLFMDKLESRHKYDIVAGPQYGRITYPGLVGPDYQYARADLDALEPFGVNAIVYIPRRGILVNSNQTAKQNPVTALSKVNVRELVTFLQDELEEMLYSYQWQLNTSTLRDKVNTKARQILELCQANGGIYWFDTKCDDQNNPPEVIDNEMIILEVDIEAGRGAGKMVQILRLHRTGSKSRANE